MAIYGTDSDNTLTGDTEIYGGNGNDLITGSAADDIYSGGQGNDILLGRTMVRSGAGTLANPYIYTPAASTSGLNTLYGGSGTDLLVGGDGDDFLYGDTGNDSGTALFIGGNFYLAGLYGGAGDDELSGGEGNDLLDGGSDADILDGGNGSDIASYYFGSAVTYSLDGSVAATGEILNDILLSIEGFSGSNTGNDVFAGDEGANTLIGNGGSDKLYGRAGNDTLDGGAGDDFLYGGEGDDVLRGGAGVDRLDGSTGTDTLSYFTEAAITFSLDDTITQGGAALGDIITGIENISGSDTGNDQIAGNDFANVLSGNGGADKLYGRGSNDNVSGGAGIDMLYGGDGNDTLAGGADADFLSGGTGTDTASYYSDGAVKISLDTSFPLASQIGAAIGDTFNSIENLSGSNTGSDTLSGNSSVNTLYGNGGNDTLFGRAGVDTLKGGSGNDVLEGGTSGDRLDGGTGTDTASYYYDGAVNLSFDGTIVATGTAIGDTFVSIESIYGSNTGSDNLAGNNFANGLSGYGGGDNLYGRGGNDTINGGEGADRLYGGDGDDSLRGNNGADRLEGGNGTDTASYYNDGAVNFSLDSTVTQSGAAAGDIYVSIENLSGSNTGNDTIAGNSVANYISGNGGNDTIYARDGDDTLVGGAGSDTLIGGAGTDRFTYGAIADLGDTITDFSAAAERVAFKSSVFGGLELGLIELDRFLLSNGNVATAVDHRFIYNHSTDTLWFDLDGTGNSFTSKMVADFSGDVNFTIANILIV